MAVGDQIGGKPGQEKPLAGSDGELADIDAPQLAVLEHGIEIVPAEGPSLLVGRAEIHQPAAAFDQFDFSLVGAGVARVAVAKPPHQAPDHAAKAGGEEHGAPAVQRFQVQ